MGKHTAQAVPAVPPFAMPTWIRPVVEVGDGGTVLAGGGQGPSNLMWSPAMNMVSI